MLVIVISVLVFSAVFAVDYSKNTWAENNSIISDFYADMQDEEGLDVSNQVVEINKKAYGPKAVETALALNYVGLFASALGKYEEATNAYVKSIDILKGKGEDQYNNVGVISGNLGSAYLDYGYYSDAEKYLKLSVDYLLKAQLTNDNEEDIILSLYDLTQTYYYQEDYDNAIKYMKQLIDFEKEVYGEDDATMAMDLRDLGYYYEMIGDYDNAEKVYNEALGILLLNPNDNLQDIGVMYNDLGVLYDYQAEYKKAIEFYNKALIYFEKLDYDSQNNIPNTIYNRALAEFSLDDLKSSKKDMEEAYRLYKAALGEYDDMTQQVLGDLEYVKELMQ